MERVLKPDTGTTARAASPDRADLLLIVVLNLLPIGGVLFWDWQAFDIIFLYWIENLIIGGFSALRMVARPYRHPVDWLFPMFIAPFFVLHYGAFCWGHGMFVMTMFGADANLSDGLPGAVTSALQNSSMILAVASLITLQAVDWVRDTMRDGLGAEGVRDLMIAPYRRIVVLHLTIILGGFVVMAMGEPVAGLLALIALKTASDVWHARKRSGQESQTEDMELTEAQLKKMREDFAEPKVTVNGKERFFASFAEMQKSREFRMMESVLRMMGARNEMKVIHTYLQMKIAEENAAVTD
jgi:hypothetical protein